MDAYRTQRLVIDLPTPYAEPWISCMLQHLSVDENDTILEINDRVKMLYKRMSDCATEGITFTDPVTQVEHTVTGAGIGSAITAMVCKWIIRDLEAQGKVAYVNEFGRVVVQE